MNVLRLRIQALQSELLAQRQRAEAAENDNRALRLKAEQFKIQLDALTIKLHDALKRLYGRRSERFSNPDQGIFEFLKLAEEASQEVKAEAAAKAALEAEAKLKDVEEVPQSRRQRRGRKPLPKDLEVIEEVIEPSAEELICRCGCSQPMVKIGTKVTELLDYRPSRCFVRRIVRIVLASPHKDERSFQPLPPLPPRPIERGRPAPGLLAHLAVSKYGDHLPLYRLEQIFERSGLELSRKTMCDWLGETAGLLEPIVDAQIAWLLERGYLQADEVPVQVMDPARPGKTRRGYLWVYGIPWAEVVFDFQSSRARDGPTKFLSKYKGFLQTDAYAGYNEIVRLSALVRVACWSHARRCFHKALPHHPEDCQLILGLIQKLYHFEREAKAAGLDPQTRTMLRRKEAKPVLEALKLAIQLANAKVLPQSLLGKAALYTLGLWNELTLYVEFGELEIDNNSIENAIRPVAIGRKNWLFLGHPEGGGERAEVFYTLIGTCKRLGINPFEYLKDVIDRVSSHPASRVRELLPRFWQAARQPETANATPA
jgi:transposase